MDFRGRPLEPGYVGYRFLHTGSFGQPSGVLIERRRDAVVLRYATAEGGAQRRVDQAEWQRLVDEVERAGFWSMPEEDPVRSPGVRHGDGWMIEGIRDGKRHRVARSIPLLRTKERDPTAFAGLGTLMMEMGGIRCYGRGCLRAR